MRRALLTLTLLLGTGTQALRLTAPVGEQPVVVSQPTMLAFQILNDTPAEWSGTPSLDLPPGWQVLFPPERLQLPPGESQVLLLPVTAPPSAPAGTHPVTLRAGAFQATALLRVEPRRDVTVQPLAGERTMLDGKVNTSFQVANGGNLPEDLALSADPLGLTVSPAQATLAPGARLTVTVTGTLPPSRDSTRRVTLKVTAQGGLSRSARSTGVALLTELPLAERALTMRGQVRFSVGPALHTHLALSGRLHPNLLGTVDLSVSDEAWRLRYQDEAFTLAAGHLTHSGLLVQPGTNLVGVSGAFRQGPWQAVASAGTSQGAFAGGLTFRYAAPQVGASLGLATSLRGTTLAADINGRSGSLRGWAGAALDLDSEAVRAAFGVSHHDRVNTATFSASYRTPGFLGEPGADLTLRAEVRHQIRSDLTASVSGTYQRDPVTPGAPTNLMVAGHLSGGQERLDASLNAEGGQVTAAGLRYQKAGWDTRATWTPEVLTAETTTAVPVGPVLLRPTLGAHLNLNTGAALPFLGLKSDWAFQNGKASIGVLSPASAGGPWTVNGGVSVKIKQTDLAVSGSMAVGGAQPHTQVRASLSYPLELVTGRRTDVGRIEGRLQRPDGQPLSGVRLRAGPLTTTTDATGRFVFPDVPQGPVQVDVVDRDATVGMRARPSLPLSVRVVGGQTTVVEVRLSPGTTVQGRVALDWPDPQQVAGSLVVPDAPALATLVVRLRGPEASYEAALTEDGRFTLSGVQPGTYDLLLSVGGKTLLSTARLITPTLTVPDGGTLQADLRLQPVTQEVQLDDGGTLELK